MMLKKSVFGKMPDGTVNYQYTLANTKGMQVKIMNYGGIITNILVPGRNGIIEDVVLGFDRLESYIDSNPYFGAITGRYANRISSGSFKIDDQSYQLDRNNGLQHLHGGLFGFDKQFWSAEELQHDSFVGLKLSYMSKDGEQKYPGNLKVVVIYTLNENNELAINYEAETDKPTPVNLTNHSYFNLSGSGSSDVLDHRLMIPASQYTVVDDQLIPTGESRSVAGSPLDFTKPVAIGMGIRKMDFGYDHNYVLDKPLDQFGLVAMVTEPVSGRRLDVFSTEPGLQFYTSNFLDGSLTGKGGKRYEKHSGFCLETQHFPDSPNHPEFPNVILRPGNTYTQRTVYKFDVSL